MFTRIYGALTGVEVPDVLGAVADARRTVQQEPQSLPDEREQRLGALGEWAALTVLSRSGVAPLLDPTASATEAVSPPVNPRLLARQVGEFVGRRREQRRWPVELASICAPALAWNMCHTCNLRYTGRLIARRLCAAQASPMSSRQT